MYRQTCILECNACYRKLARETRARQSAQPWSIVRTKTGRTGVGRHQTRFQHSRDGFGVAAFGPDGRKRVVRRAAFIGPIEDFPISQLPAPTQADAAGADATQWKRNHRELASGISSRITDAFTSLHRCAALGLGRRERGNARQADARDNAFDETTPASAGIVTHVWIPSAAAVATEAIRCSGLGGAGLKHCMFPNSISPGSVASFSSTIRWSVAGSPSARTFNNS